MQAVKVILKCVDRGSWSSVRRVLAVLDSWSAIVIVVRPYPVASLVKRKWHERAIMLRWEDRVWHGGTSQILTPTSLRESRTRDRGSSVLPYLSRLAVARSQLCGSTSRELLDKIFVEGLVAVSATNDIRASIIRKSFDKGRTRVTRTPVSKRLSSTTRVRSEGCEG